MAITLPAPTGRERKRLATMRRVQAAALDLFEARGFVGVTIEEIAAMSEVSAPTIYRHFGCKERIVLWDEYDPLLFAAMTGPARGNTLLDAVEGGLLRAVESVHAGDAERILRRARLIEQEPALRAANVSALASLRDAIARALLQSRTCEDDLEAEVVAGAVAFALETAVRRWVRAKGAKPLGSFVRAALVRLRRLTSARARSQARGNPPRERGGPATRRSPAGRVRKRRVS